jgi:predicted dithiol-disulfide oxidoreductase (DUF899 family)
MSDAAYFETQQELKQLHETLDATRKRMHELKRALALGEVEDYALTGAGGDTVQLSSLFGDKQDLIVIQNMGTSCPYCTLWADGFNGVLAHMEDRAAVVLCSPDAPEVQRAFAAGRGWRFRMVSSRGTRFKHNLGFAGEGDVVMPGVSTFRRDGDRITNVSNDFFGPGDDYCSVWHLFAQLQEGVAGWGPRLRYAP